MLGTGGLRELHAELVATADQLLDSPGVLPAQPRELREPLLDGLEPRRVRLQVADVTAERRAGLLELRERTLEQRARRVERSVEAHRFAHRAEGAAERVDHGAFRGVERFFRAGRERGQA